MPNGASLRITTHEDYADIEMEASTLPEAIQTIIKMVKDQTGNDGAANALISLFSDAKILQAETIEFEKRRREVPGRIYHGWSKSSGIRSDTESLDADEDQVIVYVNGDEVLRVVGDQFFENELPF